MAHFRYGQEEVVSFYFACKFSYLAYCFISSPAINSGIVPASDTLKGERNFKRNSYMFMGEEMLGLILEAIYMGNNLVSLL